MFESLRSLSDQQILSGTDDIVSEDRKLTLRLLAHLHEIERRKLYLEPGYSSMFVYCTSHLRLSEPAAARRLRTSRALARFPQLYEMLESGEVNLTTVSMVAKFLKPENVDAILTRIRGKSRREVERVVADLEPRSILPPDKVRTVVVVAAPAPDLVASPRSTVAGDSEESPSEPEKIGSSEPVRSLALGAATVERRALIQFTAGEEFLALVERVRSLASHRLPPTATLEQVFTLALGEYVKREDPQARHERREAKKKLVGAATSPSSPDDSGQSARQVPASVRDQVFVRDKGRCTYTGLNERQCDSVKLLQVDHVMPVALGGSSHPDNLRLLCAQHNRLEAERLMGPWPRPD